MLSSLYIGIQLRHVIGWLVFNSPSWCSNTPAFCPALVFRTADLLTEGQPEAVNNRVADLSR